MLGWGRHNDDDDDDDDDGGGDDDDDDDDDGGDDDDDDSDDDDDDDPRHWRIIETPQIERCRFEMERKRRIRPCENLLKIYSNDH